MGVSAYCTRDEALLLIHRGLSWNPILVIIGYVLNDPEVEALQPLQRYFHKPRWWQHFHIFRLVSSARFRWDIRRLGAGDYLHYLHSPGQYKWQSVITAFEDIRAATAEKGIPVLLLIFPMIKGIDSWSQ